MQNIYLVKQDPTSTKDDVVWIQMGRKEFAAFIRTDAANGRYFARLPKGDNETQNVIYETDKESHANWRVEKRHFQYLRDWETEKGYQLISYDAIGSDSGLFSAEAISDTYLDPELEVLHQIELDLLNRVLKTLTKEEYQLIHALYLAEKPLTVRELGVQLGVHFSTVSRRSLKIREKIRKFF